MREMKFDWFGLAFASCIFSITSVFSNNSEIQQVSIFTKPTTNSRQKLVTTLVRIKHFNEHTNRYYKGNVPPVDNQKVLYY
jgi:hypothetical protein